MAKKAQIELVDGSSLASVTSFNENDVIVGRKQITIAKLLEALYTMTEEGELARFILSDLARLEESIRPVLRDSTDEEIMNVFKVFTEHVRGWRDDHTMLSELFIELADNYDLQALDEVSFQGFLRHLLKETNSLKNPDIFNRMFLELLNKVNISSASDEFAETILKLLLERFRQLKDQDVFNQIFMLLLDKVNISTASEELLKNILSLTLARTQNDLKLGWLREVIKPFLARQKVVKTPLLPKGCVFYHEMLDGQQLIGIEVEKSRHDVFYYADKFEDVGHPHLLFVFTLRGERVSSVDLFAVKDAVIKSSTVLYCYPFSNVNRNGNVCWPGIGKIPINEINQLASLPDLFFRSPNNNHLHRTINLREWFTELSGADFDDSKLESFGGTIQSVLFDDISDAQNGSAINEDLVEDDHEFEDEEDLEFTDEEDEDFAA